VPFEHADGVAGLDARLAERRGEATNPFLGLPVSKSLQVAVDDFLIRGLHARRVPELLEDERVLISGFVNLNQPSNHGSLLRHGASSDRTCRHCVMSGPSNLPSCVAAV